MNTSIIKLFIFVIALLNASILVNSTSSVNRNYATSDKKINRGPFYTSLIVEENEDSLVMDLPKRRAIVMNGKKQTTLAIITGVNEDLWIILDIDYSHNFLQESSEMIAFVVADVFNSKLERRLEAMGWKVIEFYAILSVQTCNLFQWEAICPELLIDNTTECDSSINEEPITFKSPTTYDEMMFGCIPFKSTTVSQILQFDGFNLGIFNFDPDKKDIFILPKCNSKDISLKYHFEYDKSLLHYTHNIDLALYFHFVKAWAKILHPEYCISY